MEEGAADGPEPASDHRAGEMCRMRAEGQSLQAIADAFGVTRERVRQIIRDAGGPTREEALAARRAAATRSRAELRKRVLDILRAEPGLGLADLAARLGVRPGRLRTVLGADSRRFLVSTHRARSAFPDEALLQHLREAAALTEGPLTVRKYNQVRGQFGGASAPLILQRFGSWRAACAGAGVAHGRPARSHYERRWTHEQLVAAVAEYLAADHARGSFADYERWARLRDDLPSGQTIRSQLGRWSRAKAAGLAWLAEQEQ